MNSLNNFSSLRGQFQVYFTILLKLCVYTYIYTYLHSFFFISRFTLEMLLLKFSHILHKKHKIFIRL
jgi:hypothetical protein